jgi:hypothetical protein
VNIIQFLLFDTQIKKPKKTPKKRSVIPKAYTQESHFLTKHSSPWSYQNSLESLVSEDNQLPQIHNTVRISKKSDQVDVLKFSVISTTFV